MTLTLIQGDPSARGLGYVDISSVSYRVILRWNWCQHNLVCEQIGHPVQLLHIPNKINIRPQVHCARDILIGIKWSEWMHSATRRWPRPSEHYQVFWLRKRNVIWNSKVCSWNNMCTWWPYTIYSHELSLKYWLMLSLQSSAKRRAPGLVNFVPAVAYHFCLALPPVFP